MDKEKFFISCPPGFERILRQEIRDVWPWLLAKDGRSHSVPCPVDEETRFEIGGVELEMPFEMGLQLNFLLKSAHRILWRIDHFKCRDFAKLFRKFADLDFKALTGSDWKGAHIDLEVAASESRLNHEGRIRDIFRDAQKIREGKVADGPRLGVYVRNFDDIFSVSLDTSGRHLHFRSPSRGEDGDALTGTAPLRENLAFGLLNVLLGDTPWAALRDVRLIDPMAGSGTFLIEAALWGIPVDREFAFQSWKRTPVLYRQRPSHLSAGKIKWRELIGFDQDKNILEVAQRKANSRGLDPLRWHHEDLFRQGSGGPVEGRNWVISNPPYGERIRAPFSIPDLTEALWKKYEPQRVGLLLSQSQAQQAPRDLGSLKKSERKYLSFSNGGIPVVFQVWE